MRKLARTVACFVLLFVPLGMTAQDESHISSSQIQEYLRDAVDRYGEPNSTEWRHRMYRALVKTGDADATAQSLAREDGIPASIQKALMSFWFAYHETFHGRQTAGQRETARQQLWERGLGIVRASRHRLLIIGVVVAAVMGPPHCEVEKLDALLTGAPNVYQSGIKAAQTAGCTSWWLALHQRFPKDAVILTSLTRDSHNLPLATRLAFFQALERLRPGSQEARLSRIREHVTALWEAGIIPEGFAILNAALRRDLQVLLNAPPSADHSNDFRIDYIAALYVSGRAREAGNEFERLPYTKEFRSLWNCSEARVLPVRENRAADPCAGIASQTGAKWQLLESLLNRHDEDPYPLIEGGGFVISDSALWVETKRRLFTGDNYAGLRQTLAERWARYTLAAPRPDIAAAEMRFISSDLLNSGNTYEKKIRAVAAGWNVNDVFDRAPAGRIAANPPPLPRGFRELPLPEEFRTGAADQQQRTPWPSDMARLPEGFSFVRVERGIPLTIAISLSQSLDPAGEVSQGGYWVHLSRDDGMSWDTALYTGLLEYFPYVVHGASKMPLWSGDGIALEVTVKELDPASIMYPPVTTRSRRQATDLYIDIPLAALQSDRDGDSLTDIVEEHVLLDPDRADSDGDGINDGSDLLPNVENTTASSDTSYLQAVFDHFLKKPEQAIIEPVDRPPDVLFGAKFATPPSPLRPLFVEGRPEDFAGVAPTSMVLVFSAADVARLRSRSADFHALHLGPVVLNRARDRGYLSWNMGWTGGTLRLIRTGNTWHVEVISTWVT